MLWSTGATMFSSNCVYQLAEVFKESCWCKAVCKQGFLLCSHWRVSHTAGGCTVCMFVRVGRQGVSDYLCRICLCGLPRKNSILMSEQTVPITVKFTDLLRTCLWWHWVHHSEVLILKQIQKQAAHTIQVKLISCWVYPDCQSFQ